MDYTVQRIDDGLRIGLTGRLTLMDHDKFQAIVDLLGAFQGSRCIFDLAGLEFVDSSGLGMFLIARDVASPNGVAVELHRATDNVARVLEIAKFGTLFLIRA